jgi:hypothetical protein
MLGDVLDRGRAVVVHRHHVDLRPQLEEELERLAEDLVVLDQHETDRL